ncbi:MAG: hypothetical protein F4029_06020 [Gammaproteobacteria bacterium]|nr:hypothetical protein [Gammaproteobacteria bacterium]MYF30986.1 hypothetical protein [Gammaproteobacteria bacterium]MYK45766.1 hypothetical protein [Gammaproteobacteria bacterium]
MLIDRLTHVLAAATGLTAQFPAEHLTGKLPNRDRTVLALANHIVEIAAGFLLVEAGHPFDGAVAGAIPDRELDPPDLAKRSACVRARLGELRPAPDAEVETQFGTSTRHLVLERCTWHAAQHTRQLAFMLERLGIVPEASLTAADVAGLPLPEAVWDAGSS